MSSKRGRWRAERAERGPGGCLTRVLHIIHVSTCNFSLPAAAAIATVAVVVFVVAATVGVGVGRHCYAGRVVKTPKTKAKPKSKREARGAFLLLLTRSQKRGAKRASLYATISKRQLEREGRAAATLYMYAYVFLCVCVIRPDTK